MPQFVQDVEEIRQRAMRNIEEGPVTQAYGVDKERAIQVLNEALATEIVCVLRYMHHYFMSTGVHGKSVSGQFKEHADAEREHADALAERIQQLGGKPDFNPRDLLHRSVTQYVEGETLADMIREDLIAERIVIEVYTEMIRFFGDKDPTTRVLLEGLLHDEEEHANELADMLYVVDPRTGQTEGQDPGTRPLSMRPEETRQSSGRRGGPAPRAEDMGMERTERPAADEAVSAQAGRRGERRGVSNPEAARSLEGGVLRKQAERRGFDKVQKAEVPPAHAPGTRGRQPRKGADEDVAEGSETYAGEEAGTTRAVRVTNPNRKRKKAA